MMWLSQHVMTEMALATVWGRLQVRHPGKASRPVDWQVVVVGARRAGYEAVRVGDDAG
jgi:hypothetical protein